MKICTNCNLGYQDDVNVCPKCGNNNLVYRPDQQVAPQPQAAPQPAPQAAPVYAAPKPSNFKFVDFFKEYFKSPLQARQNAIARKDIGTALIWAGITFVLYFVFALCFQGGLMIRYDWPKILVSFSLLMPIMVFIFAFGFQFLNIFLYGLYSKKRVANQGNLPLAIIITMGSNRLFSSMVFFVACLFSIFSPILGGVLIAVVVGIDIYTSVMAKLNFGVKPQTFVDSVMFALTGIGSFVLAYGFTALFAYLCARMAVSSMISSFF